MRSEAPATARDRLATLAVEWGVAVDEILETEGALLARGRRAGCRVILKVLEREGEEWRSGEVLDAFGGAGVARVYEHTGGAVLLERAIPGTSLASVTLGGEDDEAARVLAGVIDRMAPRRTPPWCPTVEQWGESLARFTATGRREVPRHLLEEAHRLYVELGRSQRRPRLLHGDLHHDNVVRDARRGWLAIDPKGVIGELEYEVGAALRNPRQRPDLFAQARTVERRLELFGSRLPIDPRRALAWAFAQAVLAAIWEIEDGFAVDAGNPALLLAETIRPLLVGEQP